MLNITPITTRSGSTIRSQNSNYNTESTPINFSAQEKIESLIFRTFNDPSSNEIKKSINAIISYLSISLEKNEITLARYQQSQVELINFLRIMESVFCYGVVNLFNLQPGPWDDEDIETMTEKLASILTPVNYYAYFILTLVKLILSIFKALFFLSSLLFCCEVGYIVYLMLIASFIPGYNKCPGQEHVSFDDPCEVTLFPLPISLFSGTFFFYFFGIFYLQGVLNSYSDKEPEVSISALKCAMKKFALSKKITIDTIQNTSELEIRTLYELAYRIYAEAILENGGFLKEQQILPFIEQFSQKVPLHLHDRFVVKAKDFLNIIVERNSQIPLKAFLELGDNPREKMISLFDCHHKNLSFSTQNTSYNFFQQKQSFLENNVSSKYYGSIEI